MNFCASYSGGKDSTLAIYRAIKMGMTPTALLTTYNTDKNRSWFHGIPESILDAVSKSWEIPINIIITSGDEYKENFEKALINEREAGAECCVFGDIDIEEHFTWCEERCKATGLNAIFPLRGSSREDIVREFIDSGFVANINVLNTTQMSEEYIGQKLTIDLIEKLKSEGVDPCGENGEFHTFVSDGPMFKTKIYFTFGDKIKIDDFIVMPILNK